MINLLIIRTVLNTSRSDQKGHCLKYLRFRFLRCVNRLDIHKFSNSSPQVKLKTLMNEMERYESGRAIHQFVLFFVNVPKPSNGQVYFQLISESEL